jgi:adenylylsulfate kinase
LLHIHPIFERQLKKEDKEALLNQNAVVIWFVGLSGSGKSTLATGLENYLYSKGYMTKLLDGDNLRIGINNNLNFSEEDRVENIRRTAEVSKLFLDCGIITICSLISPTESIRKMAKEIIGQESFIEVFVDCSLEVCEQRDVKGLYAKARSGEIKNFTGISSPFEIPENPDLVIDTVVDSLKLNLKKLVEFIRPKIKKQSA